jgi:hypothetical protein
MARRNQTYAIRLAVEGGGLDASSPRLKLSCELQAFLRPEVWSSFGAD